MKLQDKSQITNHNLQHNSTQLQSGFTLLELLLYMGIMSILLGILTSTFGAILETRSGSESFSPVQQEGRYIMLHMTNDIAQSSAIVSPALGVSATTLQLTQSGTAYTYTLDSNGNLFATHSGISDQLNSYSASISGLLFQRMGNASGKHAVRMIFTVTGRTINKSGSESAQFDTLMGLR